MWKIYLLSLIWRYFFHFIRKWFGVSLKSHINFIYFIIYYCLARLHVWLFKWHPLELELLEYHLNSIWNCRIGVKLILHRTNEIRTFSNICNFDQAKAAQVSLTDVWSLRFANYDAIFDFLENSIRFSRSSHIRTVYSGVQASWNGFFPSWK